MKTSTIKNILRDNKESLKGKVLMMNGTICSSVREFGMSILAFESKGYFVSIGLLQNDAPINEYSNPVQVRRSFKKQFDTISIHAFKIDFARAIEQFGTSA